MSCDRTHGPDVTRITHLSRKAIKRISSLWALGTGGAEFKAECRGRVARPTQSGRPRPQGRCVSAFNSSVLLRFRWDFDFEFSTSLEALRPLRRQGIPARAPRRRAG